MNRPRYPGRSGRPACTRTFDRVRKAPKQPASQGDRGLEVDHREQISLGDAIGLVLRSRRNYRREEAAVVDARAKPVERLAMFGHGVALVGLETVARTIQR